VPAPFRVSQYLTHTKTAINIPVRNSRARWRRWWAIGKGDLGETAGGGGATVGNPAVGGVYTAQMAALSMTWERDLR